MSKLLKITLGDYIKTKNNIKNFKKYIESNDFITEEKDHFRKQIEKGFQELNVIFSLLLRTYGDVEKVFQMLRKYEQENY